jgi:hypothetical protein
MAQSLGYAGATTAIDGHTDDSGNGQEVTIERSISGIGSGPFTAYHFFTDAAETGFHVALEYAAGLYRHITAGVISKFGTWTGGEYLACTYIFAGQESNKFDTRHAILWDAIHTDDVRASGTLHCEGLPNQAGASKWGVLWGGTDGVTDTGGNARVDISSHLRDGFLPNAFGHITANPNNGFIPLLPIKVFYRHHSTSPEQWRELGVVNDVMGVNVRFFEPGEEVVVGADTWKLFPWWRKRATCSGEESGYSGLAVKKVS